jgi:hypothetical protein
MRRSSSCSLRLHITRLLTASANNPLSLREVAVGTLSVCCACEVNVGSHYIYVIPALVFGPCVGKSKRWRPHMYLVDGRTFLRRSCDAFERCGNIRHKMRLKIILFKFVMRLQCWKAWCPSVVRLDLYCSVTNILL